MSATHECLLEVYVNGRIQKDIPEVQRGLKARLRAAGAHLLLCLAEEKRVLQTPGNHKATAV